MTERERWVVYPLLFLALGVSLRDKLVDRTVTKSVVCQELRVVDEDSHGGEPSQDLVRIGRLESTSGAKQAGVMINGRIEIVDGDPAGTPPPHTLLTIGRTDGDAEIGFAIIDGLINARQYVCNGIPFMPPLRVLPGTGLPSLWRGFQTPGQKAQKPTAPNSQPPKPHAAAPKAKTQPHAAPPSPPADKQPTSMK
jgi:hypothetical protein